MVEFDSRSSKANRSALDRKEGCTSADCWNVSPKGPISTSTFSLFRSSAGASSNVTLAHCLVVLRRLQIKEDVLVSDHDFLLVTQRGNVPLQSQRRHTNSKIKVKGNITKKDYFLYIYFSVFEPEFRD